MRIAWAWTPVLTLPLLLGGQCQFAPTDEEVAGWKQASADLAAEIGNIQADLILVEDPVQRAKIERALAEIAPTVDRLNDAVQRAESGGDVGWGLLEGALLVAAGFFPWAAAIVPFVRSARRIAQKKVFDVVLAGGGPKNPDAAKAAMATDPKLMAEFEVWKASSGA